MLLSGHQPVYLPGLILFNKIAMSDAFMFVGHVQYSRKSWQTRNFVRVGDKPSLLSVPVKKSGRFGEAICDVVIENDHWKRKHLKTIQLTYSKRPYFDEYFPRLEQVLMRDYDNLGDMNMTIIREMLDWFGVDTPIYDSRDFKIEGNKTDMLISMCQSVGADRYLSNLGSLVYVDEDLMAKQGIRHYWQDFHHPEYDQGKPFLENLSAIDALFNLGPGALEAIISAGRPVERHELPDGVVQNYETDCVEASS